MATQDSWAERQSLRQQEEAAQEEDQDLENFVVSKPKRKAEKIIIGFDSGTDALNNELAGGPTKSPFMNRTILG